MSIDPAAKGGLRVTVRASEPGGRLARVEIATVPEAGQTIAAVDGVTDSSRETFLAEVVAREGEPLAVRATDAAGNVTTTRAGE